MKSHIKAFDPLIMAMIQARRGNTVLASQLFAKACVAPDAVRAIMALELNSQQAFKTSAAAISAVAKAQVQAASNSKPKNVVKAQSRIQAAEDEDFDIEDDDTTEDEFGDDEVPDEVETEDEVVDDGSDQSFEATLAKFMGAAKKAKASKARK